MGALDNANRETELGGRPCVTREFQTISVSQAHSKDLDLRIGDGSSIVSGGELFVDVTKLWNSHASLEAGSGNNTPFPGRNTPHSRRLAVTRVRIPGMFDKKFRVYTGFSQRLEAQGRLVRPALGFCTFYGMIELFALLCLYDASFASIKRCVYHGYSRNRMRTSLTCRTSLWVWTWIYGSTHRLRFATPIPL